MPRPQREPDPDDGRAQQVSADYVVMALPATTLRKVSFKSTNLYSTVFRNADHAFANGPGQRAHDLIAIGVVDPLGEGIEHTYNWFLANHASARGVERSA